MSGRQTLIITIWIIFGVSLIRAIRTKSICSRRAQRTWLMYFWSILACSFWGRAAENQLDQFFAGLPVALYLKYVCLISVCHLYRQMQRDVLGLPYSFWIDNLWTAATSIGILSLIGYAWFKPISLEALRYIVIGARDAVIVTYILGAFLNGIHILLKQETDAIIRFKQRCIALFFIFFAVSAVGSISAAVFTLLGVSGAAEAAQIMQPWLYLAILLFISSLLPYSWIAPILVYRRICLYRRIRRLEREVYELTHRCLDPG